MENVRRHRDIQFGTTGKRRIYLVSKPNYHTTSLFSENLLAIKMKKKQNKNPHEQTNLIRAIYQY